MSNIRSTKATLTLGEANAFICMVRAAGEARDRLHDVSRAPMVRINPPHGPVVPAALAGDVADFTPHERALYRALRDRFAPERCIELVLRARRAGGA